MLPSPRRISAKRTKYAAWSYLARHKTLPVSPFRLRSAVLSCASSISMTCGVSSLRVCLADLPFRDLDADLDPEAGGVGCDGAVSSNWMERVSLRESTCPRPWNPSGPARSSGFWFRAVYTRKICDGVDLNHDISESS
jgi:hypothetical protein